MRALIRPITTIVLAITFPGVGHASSIVTLELRRTASNVDATGFVGKVSAVVFGVAFEGGRDAAAGSAREL